MRILGISAFYHDSAAALVQDGVIVAAAQEERFTRRKHDAGFPSQAIEYCLAEGRVSLQDIDHVVFYEKPFLKFDRLLETYLATAPRGFLAFQRSLPVWLQEKLFQKSLLKKELNRLATRPIAWDQRLLFTEHHLSHAASAFYPSPFEEAAILTMDGVGEWATTSTATGKGSRLEITKEIHFPHSLGLLYSAFTYHLGFEVNSGEYKVMGLAPYGQPRYTQTILDNLLDLKPDGSFRLNQDFFDYCAGSRMTNARFDGLFGSRPRKPEEPLEQRHKDLAASVQVALEEAVLRMTRALAKETGMANLCLAGGVALNCVCNGKILRDGHFRDLWVQPAAGDAGGALGAALAAYHQYRDQPRPAPQGDAMRGAYLGPGFSQVEIEQRLTKAGATFTVLDENSILETTVDALIAQKAVGWFQGRMEFGPRALGARSILGDPRSPQMQSILNLKVKRRESFRPFAPVILRNDLSDWFDLNVDSPYMSLVAQVIEGRQIPAVTHTDGSARIQTIHHETNPKFQSLLERFKQRTGCPLLLNTSFNVKDEPIVCSPEDAYRCFQGTEIEVLIAGNCRIEKADS